MAEISLSADALLKNQRTNSGSCFSTNYTIWCNNGIHSAVVANHRNLANWQHLLPERKGDLKTSSLINLRDRPVPRRTRTEMRTLTTCPLGIVIDEEVVITLSMSQPRECWIESNT